MIFWFTGQPGSGKTTLGKALIEKLGDGFHIDGDDLRGLSANADYSEQGRIQNIRTAQSIAMFLDNKGQDVVVSVIAPYKWLREEFKERHKVNEIYLHTTEIRGREHYFAEDYEAPTDNFLDLDTTKISIDECIEKLINNDLWEVFTVDQNGIEDAAIHVMKERCVFQSALSVYKGVVTTDYIDIHTLEDIKMAEKKLEMTKTRK